MIQFTINKTPQSGCELVKLVPCLFIAFCILGYVGEGLAATALDPLDDRAIYSQPGVDSRRDFLRETNREAVNAFSGQVHLSNTEIKIPGNSGLDIILQRHHASWLPEWYYRGMPITLYSQQWSSNPLGHLWYDFGFYVEFCENNNASEAGG